MHDAVPPDLLALRERIDDLDRRFVELLAERNDLVAKVADVKRRSGYPIRDSGREQRMLETRRTLGTSDGIRPEVVESLFRVILWASRDRQASLRAAVPVQVEPEPPFLWVSERFTWLGASRLAAFRVDPGRLRRARRSRARRDEYLSRQSPKARRTQRA